MIKSVNFELSGGEFEFVQGNDFSVTSDTSDHLVYEKNGVWYVISDPSHTNYAKTVITFPDGYSFCNFSLKITDGTATLKNIKCDNTHLDIRCSIVEASNVNSQNLYLSAAKGDLRISANSLYTHIDCGFGTINAILCRTPDGYSINSRCGNGNVILNSSLLSKRYSNENGDRKIDVICGMGDVYIDTEHKF